MYIFSLVFLQIFETKLTSLFMVTEVSPSNVALLLAPAADLSMLTVMTHSPARLVTASPCTESFEASYVHAA